MECPLKLMEATVSQPLAICNESRKCRFSDLPDHVVHHIFFLCYTNLLRFKLVSKRCRELYLTNPFRTFDFLKFRLYSIKEYGGLDLLDRLLVELEGRKICRFCIQFGSELGMELYRIITWLHVAVECNVEILDLELHYNESKRVDFPLCLFHCESLRSVAVNLHGCFLGLPSSLGFTYLQSLSITSVKIDKSFSEWISSYCVFLEELWLEHIEEICKVSIKIPSLVRFTLVEPCSSQLCHLRIVGGKLQVINVEWTFNSSIGKSLKICAPNLKQLMWNGNPTNDNRLEPLMQLEVSRLFLEPKEDTNKNLHKILLGVSKTKDLVVRDHMIKVLYEQGYRCPSFMYIDCICTLAV